MGWFYQSRCSADESICLMQALKVRRYLDCVFCNPMYRYVLTEAEAGLHQVYIFEAER